MLSSSWRDRWNRLCFCLCRTHITKPRKAFESMNSLLLAVCCDGYTWVLRSNPSRVFINDNLRADDRTELSTHLLTPWSLAIEGLRIRPENYNVYRPLGDPRQRPRRTCHSSSIRKRIHVLDIVYSPAIPYLDLLDCGTSNPELYLSSTSTRRTTACCPRMGPTYYTLDSRWK